MPTEDAKKKNRRDRVSVVVVSENKLLGFYAEDPHSKKKYFFLPGGVPEPGETLIVTAERETLEETGYSIDVLAEPKIFRRYDFEWNGQINDCHTWYFMGRLNRPETLPVNDAAYHRGVGWISLSEIESVFSYHRDILEPIRNLLKSIERISK